MTALFSRRIDLKYLGSKVNIHTPRYRELISIQRMLSQTARILTESRLCLPTQFVELRTIIWLNKHKEYDANKWDDFFKQGRTLKASLPFKLRWEMKWCVLYCREAWCTIWLVCSSLPAQHTLGSGASAVNK